MKLERIKDGVQLFSESDREKFMIVNMNERDINFKRVMLDRDRAKILKQQLNSLPELDDEPGENEN